MKRTLLAVPLGLAFFLLGWSLSGYLVHALMGFFIPPHVSVYFTHPTTPFELHAAWALFIGTWGITIVFCTRNRLRTVLLMSIALGVCVVCLSLGIHKLIVRADIQTQQAMQTRPVTVSLDELGLVRSPMLGAIATCVVVLFGRRIERRRVGN